jgi:hypothetical protein
MKNEHRNESKYKLEIRKTPALKRLKIEDKKREQIMIKEHDWAKN